MKNWLSQTLLLCILAVPVSAEQLKIVTDILPVHGLVSAVTGKTDASLIVTAGASPHHFTLRPSTAQKVAAADVVFWVGPQLSPWLEEPLGKLASGAAIVQLHHGEHDGHDEHGRDEDPHVWLDPEVAADWIGDIAEALIRANPEQADLYRANANAILEKLEKMNDRVEATFKESQPAPYVVYHDAYAGFEHHYGLEHVAAVTDGHATTPGAAKREQLQKLIAENDAKCMFYDSIEPPALAKRIAKDSNLELIYLDPLGSKMDASTEFPVQLIQGIADSLLSCN